MSPRRTRSTIVGLFVAALWGLGCSGVTTPEAPAENALAAHPGIHAVSQSEEKGYIDGWFDGGEVQLYYTKSYFCAEPPSSGAPSDCEIGAPAEVAPRPGPIPTIYAIAAVGFQPDPATVACLRGSPCLNHPAMIDVSRTGGPVDAQALSHSHILDARGGGWFHTVNIRVFSATAWDEIAAAKTLAKVRELQGDNPAVGVPGVISADTDTNIYFFIAGWR
ncbi:MAG TPA: hypothetical protein VGA78_17610 [Gemmatimonadales bacterium]